MATAWVGCGPRRIELLADSHVPRSIDLAGPQLEGPTGSLPIVRISEEARATEEEVAGMIGVVACEKGAFAQAINKRNSRAVGLSDSESFAVCYPDGSIAALVLRDKLSPEGAAAWKEFEGIHDAIAVPWALGCEAEANTDPQRVLASLKTPEGAAGLRIVGGFHVSSIGARSGNTDNKLMVTYTNREGKEIVFGTGGCPVDRHRYSSTEVEHIYDRHPAVAALLGELRELYAEHTLPFMRAKGFPAEVIDGLDPLSGTELASIVCNEHMKRMGIHHDPLAPLPAGIAGPTGWELREEIWRRQHKGGRLFLADGLFCLEYRPRDLVLLDGRFAHGVSSLRELGGQESVRYRPELRRFSTVLFSRWKSEKVKCEKTIRKAGLFATWDKKWWDSVPWKEGKWPAEQEGGGGPLGRGHRTRVQAVRYTDSATEGRQGGS